MDGPQCPAMAAITATQFTVRTANPDAYICLKVSEITIVALPKEKSPAS
jgi:hypothetical protein